MIAVIGRTDSSTQKTTASTTVSAFQINGILLRQGCHLQNSVKSHMAFGSVNYFQSSTACFTTVTVTKHSSDEFK